VTLFFPPLAILVPQGSLDWRVQRPVPPVLVTLGRGHFLAPGLFRLAFTRSTYIGRAIGICWVAWRVAGANQLLLDMPGECGIRAC
jgi:uncharacterized membrane protein YqaE (UPF0057 family)